MHVSYLLSAVVLAFCGAADAFWRMGCSVVQVGRIDPLVNPGTIAAHAHTIVGGSNIGVNATYESLLNSRCTSCEIQADKSAYWTPLLYYQHPNGSFSEVPHSGSVVYYLGRGANAANVQPYPKGFKMLSGNKAARSFDNQTYTIGNASYPPYLVAERVSFACLTLGPEPPQTWGLPANVSSCINGLRAQIQFQACWDGINLYKSDNSHVAYMSQLDDGICPPGYPVQLISLFLETDYSVGSIDSSDGGQFVFSQGDATGYGFHGDFQNGWDQDVQTEAVRNCAVPENFGQISYCPVLEATDTNGYAYNCPEQPPQVGEPVHGLIDKLPGCITVTYGPEDASASDMECAADVVQPTVTVTADSTPAATVAPTASGQNFGLTGYRYMGCGNDSAGGTRALNSIQYDNYTAMTVQFCQAYCTNLGYRYSGVEYAQECHCDNAINPSLQFGSNQCSWQCGGTSTSGSVEICGGYGYISIYNNTNPDFVPFGNNALSSNPDASAGLPAPFAKNYLGCASDPVVYARTLSGATTTNANMSVELCGSFCSANNGYQYYGIEYGTQCYCGNAPNSPGTILNTTSSPSNSTCSMRCPGSNLEICGGPSVLSLYNNTAHIPVAAKSPIGKYVSKGCLAEPSTGRALNGPSLTSNSMTNEMCVKFCLGKEMHYAGVEYATQCFCDNKIESGAVAETCPVGQLMLCAGNSLEYCGGPSLLDLYYSVTL